MKIAIHGELKERQPQLNSQKELGNMKLLLISFISALSADSAFGAFFTSEAPERSNETTGPAVKYDYNMETPGSATKKCALVNIVMDESGSMSTEQNFLRQTAIPKIVEALHTPTYGYTDVFVCSNGFGGYLGTDFFDYRYLGCTKGNPNSSNGSGLVNSAITNWQVRGHWEEGYWAMSRSMENVPQVIEGVNLNTECSELHKNMILVTDEVSFA